MPQDRPGTLADATYAALVAYIYQENGTAPRGEVLSDDPDVLAAMSPPRWSRGGGGGLAPGVALPAYPMPRNPLLALSPVTDAMLEDVAPADWLLWRRTYDAYGFSPLDTIDRTNVGDLRVAWSWSLPPGPNESTPIVHDGVLFIHGYGDAVQALDAATGDLLWHYSRRLPRGTAPSVKRGMSLYGELLYVPTSDAHIVALEARIVSSAGSQPGSLHPLGTRAMAEIGIDISNHYSKGMDQVPADAADIVVTLCAEEVCPVTPPRVERLHWPISDPAAGGGGGGAEDQLEAFRAARADLQHRILDLWDRITSGTRS